ncbi:MAG: hypothetical protein JNM56_08550 [Planctomycetia bacterium]|nr:hypothetical protein [Planctomycetia bacterium]
MKANWLKVYDKFGLVLRVGTVVRAPRGFSVYRARPRRGGRSSVGY